MLLQPHLYGAKRILYPVAYYNKKLTNTQSRYFSQERELLAVILSLQHWRHWVEGGDITVISDHQTLKDLNTKAKQLARIVKFLDAMEHFGARVLYRPGKANVLADYLSKPPEAAYAAGENGKGQTFEKVIRLKQLNRLDLQAIYEHIAYDKPLPPIMNDNWVRKHFIIHKDEFHRVSKHIRDPGDPPHSGGLAIKAIIMLRILEQEEL
jgi:hypothetical protein